MTTSMQVNEKDVEDFCKQNNFFFEVTSAKDGTGIEEIFQKIAEKFLINEGKLTEQERGKKIEDEPKKKKKKSFC
ncbi:MAG: hypothetical protein MJ252_17575 [archaeon]|nr:hypothetical protein [archaeon]